MVQPLARFITWRTHGHVDARRRAWWAPFLDLEACSWPCVRQGVPPPLRNHAERGGVGLDHRLRWRRNVPLALCEPAAMVAGIEFEQFSEEKAPQ